MSSPDTAPRPGRGTGRSSWPGPRVFLPAGRPLAGRGISLCPASAETFYARLGLAFVASQGMPPASLCVAWRADDTNPAVRRFVEVVTTAAHAARTG
ncbi:MAG TPA: hypothetical protein VMV92_31330 [Streptosporangiaceae bacterium]|nr:hypothetical protein [Streptosporangiaceae bacterium]